MYIPCVTEFVHETREAIIPLTDNETWDKAIAGMLYLLKEI